MLEIKTAYSIKIYDVLPIVRKVYKKVKGNSKLADSKIIKKLSRNIALATFIMKTDKGEEVYRYGNLKIVVYKDIVVHIRNFHSDMSEFMTSVDWKEDLDRYNQLNEELGLVGL